MKIAIVGADFEENLGVGMIAAVARDRGHAVSVVPFDRPRDLEAVAARVAAEAPDVVGLSVQFQHRAHEFLALARALRQKGYRGHVTSGGQFPTLAWRDVLGPAEGVDSVVLHDGEGAFGELLDALGSGGDLRAIRGLALRGPEGPARTEGRPLVDDLDALPFALRYRPHARHCGVPFVPIMGSRGCWGKCSYCSITSHYRDARELGGGKTFRLRSPEDVADEMADLWLAAGEACIFCFHDDNLLLPRPADTLARMRAIRARLDARGVRRIGIVGKCRPETITRELARDLRALGVIRLYVGVENASARGAEHLGRGKQHLAIGTAIDACREAGIFNCYNLLLFEPEARLEDVEENVAFMRSHARHPVNFCRAEPYVGTPLQLALAAEGNLGGSWLGYDYRIHDDRTEVLFRVCAAAFRDRNFKPDGVGNRAMGLGYSVKVLEQFYDDPVGERARIAARTSDLTRRITLDTVQHLERAIAIARGELDEDRVARETAALGLAIARADAEIHRELDEAYASFDAFQKGARDERRRLRPPVTRFAKHVAIGASLALGVVAPACGGKKDDEPTLVDPLPPDAGADSPFVSDPLPGDAGIRDASPDARDAADAAPDVTVVDPPPPDAGVDAALDRKRLRLIDQWRDTSPKRAVRSDDLPLWEPPDLAIEASLDGEVVVARARTRSGEAASLRWEGDGTLHPEGDTVRWVPADPGDALRLAVRTRGGVAVTSLRAGQIRRG